MKSSSQNCVCQCVVPYDLQETIKADSNLFEAAFNIPGIRHLQLNPDESEEKVAEYLDHAVVRTPGDLRTHVQRVNLHLARQDGEAAYGALVDLFIVLTDKGRPLRERMLNLSQKHIGEERYSFLFQHLAVGISATDTVPPSRTSLLSKGLSGTNRLVIKLGARGTYLQDPLEEAHDHLEYGQIDEARQVLEEAILKDSGRPDLHSDLLEIYKSTNAREAFLAMRQRLNTDTNPLADAWHELAVYFGEEN